MAEAELIIDGKTYTHVKTRAYTPISVYKGRDVFLRIGDREELEKEARDHQKLVDLGFPVPKIVNEGEKDGKFYYEEESFGEDHLGALFAKEYESTGKISDESFRILIDVSKRFAEAQLKTAKSADWKKDYYDLTHIDWMIEELPEIKDLILEAFEKSTDRLKALPSVLTHGDFNTWNLFPQGVIDLEKLNNAPAGFDLISNIYHMWVFPKDGDYEMMRSSQFNKEQVSQYLKEIDAVYTSHELPAVSDFQDELFLGRMTWGAARMQRWPKIQQWRYDLFKRLLETYMKGESIIGELTKD